MGMFPRPEAVTDGDRFHFFGYYDKSPWDASGRCLLALEADFMDRRPGPDDVARVCVIDTQEGNSRRVIGETRAWNWQQGCMLQWLPGAADTAIYNDRDGDRFVARVVNVRTGERRTLPMPVYAVSPDGRTAISLSFSRLFDVRPGYGYAGVPDPNAADDCPDGDGLYRLDLHTGETRLILSLADARRLGDPSVFEGGGKHRFNHAQFNRDGSRFAVLHRWTTPGGPPWRTRLLTLGPDGSEPFVLSDHAMVSHYDWRDARTLVAWARRNGVGDRYFLFTDGSEAEPDVLGEGIFSVDGHCSFSPDARWMLTDTYPDPEAKRTLMLYDVAANRRHDIGRFWGPNPKDGEIRCDLHPRWSRDGRKVCIDSIHEDGHRRMYVLDVSPFIDGKVEADGV